MCSFRRRLFTVTGLATSAALAGALFGGPAGVATPMPAGTGSGLTSVSSRSAVPTATFVERITAGRGPVTDRAKQVWKAQPPSLRTRHLSTRLTGVDVRGTSDDVLYRANAWGTPGYSLAVPAAGNYTVRLLMAEDTFSTAGRRVFDVKAEGRTVAARVDIAKAVGKGAAYDVRFTTPVRDGELNLDFVRRVDEPLISAIEVRSAAPVPTSAITALANRRAVTFAPGNPFVTRVDSAPLAPNSAAVAADIAKQVRDNWGGTAGVSAYAYNVGFNVAARGTKRITVGFHDCQAKKAIPTGLYDGPKMFMSVPVPGDATAAAGTDAAMTIYDPASDQLWDFWQMRRNARTKAWEACWGGRIDQVSKQQRPVFPSYFGASASGLAIAAGMITLDDVRRGSINHAMTMAVIDAARWDKVSWPANRSDGISMRANTVMEGQRLRLDPRLDLSRYALTPFGRMVAEAAQKYGFIVADKGGAVAVSTESGLLTKKRTGVDPWSAVLAGPDYSALSNFPWDKMQVLPPHYGRTTP